MSLFVSEVVSHHQHADQGEKDGDEREVISHTRQHQPHPPEPGGADIVCQDDEREKKKIGNAGKKQEKSLKYLLRINISNIRNDFIVPFSMEIISL